MERATLPSSPSLSLRPPCRAGRSKKFLISSPHARLCTNFLAASWSAPSSPPLPLSAHPAAPADKKILNNPHHTRGFEQTFSQPRPRHVSLPPPASRLTARALRRGPVNRVSVAGGVSRCPR
eukprot:scaffold104169_cov25-Tisochrysis_lutea.AAC.1